MFKDGRSITVFVRTLAKYSHWCIDTWAGLPRSSLAHGSDRTPRHARHPGRLTGQGCGHASVLVLTDHGQKWQTGTMKITKTGQDLQAGNAGDHERTKNNFASALLPELPP